MPSFCSFLIFRPDEIDFVETICIEAGWSVSNIPDPSTRHRFYDTGKLEIHHPSALRELKGDEQLGRLLVIHSDDEDEVDNIVHLICAACVVLDGFATRNSRPTMSFPIDKEPSDLESLFENVFRSTGYFERFVNMDNLPVAAALAAKAWADPRLIYAIHKLAESYETESVTPWSMHPRNGQIFQKHTASFASHVGTSIAINLAYSVIEELGLSIFSSKENPRWLNNQTFEWNPKVLEKLETKLSSIGIGQDEVINWISRGEATEALVHPVRETPADFSDGAMVRDVKLSIPDAINRCQYLRNFMTAHAFAKETPLLGPYEVYNVQQVARFLILKRCAIWQVWIKELKAHYGAVGKH
jgi:hypothetical protein